MKKMQLLNKNNQHKRTILLIFALFFIPKLINPTLISTTDIFKNYLFIFLNSGVYFVCIMFLLNSGLIFTAIYLLLNENIRMNAGILIHKKRTFISLFIGYFIYLFYLISLLVQKSIDIQTGLGKDMNDIVYTLTVFSILLIYILIYLIRRDICLGEINVGSFILLLLGSAILFETFIGFSPLVGVYYIFSTNVIVEKDIAIQFVAPYYFSILSGILLSIIDLRFLNTHK